MTLAEAYRAALDADAAFSRQLTRAYGSRAGDMRYIRTHLHRDARVRAAALAKLAADNVYWSVERISAVAFLAD